jgi:hypothetical protein
MNDQAAYHQRLTTDGGVDPLTVDNDQISAYTGGKSVFSLDAGVANGNRNYLIFGGVTGTAPGTPLPGGMAVLPINWDAFTNMVISMVNGPAFDQFMGTLNGSGNATATLNLPPIPGVTSLVMYYAFALNNKWDFVSNPVEIHIVP